MKQLFIAITLTLLSFTAHAQQEITNTTHPKLPTLNLQMADGSIINTHDLLGQPYVLHFWATWCPYCKKLQPALQKIDDMGLKVIAVSFKEDEDAAPAKALSDRGYTFKTAIKADAIAKQLGIRGTPTTLFINKQGDVIWLTNTSNPEDANLHLNARTLLHSMELKTE
ncbi:TlpA family protein disulfide reductase [Pseudoalteromonas sp. 1_2015MBL_MicDiv]|uniref:TlpA family protein disulfide reductase n=1 Tax=Pseudoalteromonas sp. 1_2015MBL_MicDiv TaxID=1720343 RepID=UPI000BBE83C0|nr:TlpA disulfide reductase family protein [Pseudoalteromonas sp. 1_2015MBL_MicDiv]ATG78287.1 thioredoxin [Pseudoalteromonas sp. 1_2015MBL_MicDiv]